MFFCGRNKYGRNKEEYFAKSISIMDIVKFFRWLLKALKVFHNWCTRGKSKSFEKHTKNELFELQILFYLWNILLYTFLHGMMNSFSFTIRRYANLIRIKSCTYCLDWIYSGNLWYQSPMSNINSCSELMKLITIQRC